MDLNDSTDTDFSGYSLSDLPADNDDKEHECLYRVVETCLGECITITFQSKQIFDNFMTKMSAVYDFQLNSPQTALTTTIAIAGQRTVITSFKTMKVVVQGTMAKSWKQTVFKQMIDTLDRGSNPADTLASQKPMTRSKSWITSIPAKLKLNLSSTSDPKYLKEMKKAKKMGDMEYHAKLIEGWKNGVDLKTIKKTGSSPVNSKFRHFMSTGETALKKVYKINPLPIAESNTVDCTINSEKTEEIIPPFTNLSRTSSEPSVSTNDSCTQTVNTDLDLFRQQILDLQTETANLKMKNKELTVKISEQSQQLKSKQTKSQSSNEALKDLQEKLAAANAKCLIQEEENLKLRQTVKQVKQENSKLRNEISKKSLVEEDTIEKQTHMKEVQDDVKVLKIELHQLKQKMESTASTSEVMQIQQKLKAENDEISKLKSEMEKIKKQKKQLNLPEAASSHNSEKETNKRQEIGHNSKTQNVNPTNNSESVSNPQSSSTDLGKPKILILGDSVTGVLDRKRLQGNEMEITIRTNTGARVCDMAEQFKSLPVSDFDVVVTHVGINNITDAESPETIFEGYKKSLQTIRQRRKCKILVSSILPKKHDKLSIGNIEKLNSLLQSYCRDNDLTYIDNTKSFMTEDKSSNKALFRDEIHLNHNGAAVLAKQLKTALFTILNIRKSVNFHQARPRQDRWNRNTATNRRGIPSRRTWMR